MKSIVRKTSTTPVVSMEELPIVSDTDRVALLASLKQAEREISEGKFDILTREKLRAEYEASRK
jgi:hypothetical protein